MPEPRRGEPADEYRVRLREFMDFHENRFETIESSRRSWVDICSRHEVASGCAIGQTFDVPPAPVDFDALLDPFDIDAIPDRGSDSRGSACIGER
jgi:hypothetical protein